MKKSLLSALFAVFAVVAFGQSNFGKDYFGIGAYTKAKEYFQAQLASAPAESNYYLGEIAWHEGSPADALAFYEKGLAADPQYAFNLVGKGKTMLKENQKAAEVLFATALKSNKKNPEMQIAIARAYYENGMVDIAKAKIEVARKAKKNASCVFILEGDMFADKEKWGDAAGKYEQALYFDPANVVAAVKSAAVYESTNPSFSVEKLNTLLTAHPDYTILYRNLGRAYNAVGNYKLAIENFVKYYGEGECALEDIYRLASAYYFYYQYDKSIVLLDKGLAVQPDNFVFNRLRMYSASKTKDPNGLQYADKFFALKGNVITEDYTAYANILASAGKINEALEQYNKVLSSGSVKPETYRDLAPIYTKMGDHVKAAEMYQKCIEMAGGADVAEGMDFYSLGRSWYAAGQAAKADTLSAEKQKLALEYLGKADSAFVIVGQKSPESYIGPLWRGHTNSVLDPETKTALAKPFYEDAMAKMEKRIAEGDNVAKYRRDLIICYNYEAYYYFMKEDKANASIFCNKILAIDPNNAQAKAILEQFNPPAAPVKVVKKATSKPAAK